LDSSFWQQIESTVSHDALRQKNQGNDDDESKALSFDDSKIYQNLLKEFVATHPSADGLHRAQDRLRSPGTRRTVNKVDRRASKGRKLRYTPIPKLANFTYPLSRPSALLEEDAWFQSLFGGAAVQTSKKS
jgi:protein AATF/BFR2